MKMGFFPFGKTDVYAYAFEQGTLYAQCESDLSLKTHSVRIHLPRAEKFDAKLKVLQSIIPCLQSWKRIESLYKKAMPHVYKMAFANPGDFEKYMEVLLQPLPSQEERRAEPRRKTNLRVTSRYLPNFNASVIDISLSGLCLATAGPMPKGTEFPLRLELDCDQMQQQVDCNVRVCWCAESGQVIRLGVSFVEIPARLYSAIRRYMDWIERIDQGMLGGNNIRG